MVAIVRLYDIFYPTHRQCQRFCFLASSVANNCYKMYCLNNRQAKEKLHSQVCSLQQHTRYHSISSHYRLYLDDLSQVQGKHCLLPNFDQFWWSSTFFHFLSTFCAVQNILKKNTINCPTRPQQVLYHCHLYCLGFKQKTSIYGTRN